MSTFYVQNVVLLKIQLQVNIGMTQWKVDLLSVLSVLLENGMISFQELTGQR